MGVFEKKCDTCANTFWRKKDVVNNEHIWCLKIASVKIFFETNGIYVLLCFREIKVWVSMFEEFLWKNCDTCANTIWKKKDVCEHDKKIIPNSILIYEKTSININQ